jgi:hypothetical protein
MKTFDYNCKFCGKPGTVEGDEAGLHMFKPEVWLPKMACNRCGKYLEEKRRQMTDLLKACRVLQTCRASKGDKVKAIEEQTHLKLEILTKRFSTLVCDYYRLTNVWDREFPELLFEKPHAVEILVGVYIRGMAHEAKKAYA